MRLRPRPKRRPPCELVQDGAAFDWRGRRMLPEAWGVVGYGRALCACRWYSAPKVTAEERRAEHAAHLAQRAR
jgi:hypothetical protein